MTTTPLPPPVPLTGLDCYIDPQDGKVKRYDKTRADLEAEVQRLREALEFVARHKSSDWPERCQQMVNMARNALRDQP